MTTQATRTIASAKPTTSAKPVATAKPTTPVAKPTAPVAKPAPTPAPAPVSEVPPEPEAETNGNGNDNSKREFVNRCELTVHLAAAPEMRYSAEGHAWTRVRAFVSMGKNADNEYKPALWITLKAFTTKDGDDSLPNTLNTCEKGNVITVSGRLAYEEYTTAEGEIRGSLILIANAIA